MNDQQIYVLMAKTPDIRAVQIADALDMEVDDVLTALGPLIRIGDVAQKNGFSPNGFPALQFNLTGAFKASPEYAEIAAIVAAQRTAVAPAAAAEPVKLQAPPAASLPVFIPKEQARASRSDLGVDYLMKMQRPVDNNELRTAMGLTRAQYPAAFLKEAISSGKVHKDGDRWKAGPAPDVQVDRKPDDGHASQVEPACPGAPVFRCGLWSDGVLELQRNGATVAVLQQAEGEQLTSFVNRMLANPLGTPVQTSTQG